MMPASQVRETGLPWIPTCPAHWKIVRPKTIFRRMQRPVQAEDGVVTAFRDGIVTLRKNRRTTGFTEALQEIGYQGIRKGDLVIHAMDAFAGAIGVSDSDGKGTPVYSVCQSTGDANSWYYALVLREMSRSGYLLSLSKGIRERSTDFRFADFASLMVPLPPVEEQEQIVRFVRHVDSKVNRLIKAKRRLIELLNEQKQAIIHQAVTRGLDPTVPLKPSGLVWIPQIPSHWEVVPNGSLMKPKKRLVGERHTEFTLLSLTKQGVIVRDLSENKGKFSKDFGTSQEVREGDIVFCLFDIPETPRTVGLSSHRGMITSAYTVMTPKDSEVARFVEAFYIAMDNGKLLSPMYSGLRNTIAPSRFLSMRMPLPPKEERGRIVGFIESESASIAGALAKIVAEIDLIREYRTRLVADVVTGQLDVRHLDLPEVEEQLEALIEDSELEDELDETEDVLEEAGV